MGKKLMKEKKYVGVDGESVHFGYLVIYYLRLIIHIFTYLSVFSKILTEILDIKPTCQKFLLLLRRFPNLYKHPESSDPELQLFQSDELPTKFRLER